MTIAITLMLGFAFTPVRYTNWLSGAHELATNIFAPISQPMRAVATWLNPPAPEIRDRELADLQEESKNWKTLARQFESENRRLRDLVADLQSGRRVEPRIAVRYLSRPVIGAQSDPGSALLTVRAGEGSGVTERSTVATVRGVQLVGAVKAVGARTCTIQPITSDDHPQIRGAIVLEGRELPLETLLTPVGDGTLRGGVEIPAPTPDEPTPPEITLGSEVVLADDVWPQTAQQLLIGLVERVEAGSGDAGRPIVIVRPTVRVRRVSEVVLRIPLDPDTASSSISGGRP
ncbi:MAG: rod shape-determining protein MreC [Planctomycetota bacterium]